MPGRPRLQKLLWVGHGGTAPARVNTYDFQLAVASSLIRFGDNGN